MITGHFHKSGSPAIEITIQGINPNTAKTFTGIIDTGFTGYAQIPLVQAFGLALVLENISTAILADGSKSYSLLCWGQISAEGTDTHGLISLSHGGDAILLGTTWLDKMNVDLRVDCTNKSVLLVPQQTAPTGSSPTSTTPKGSA